MKEADKHKRYVVNTIQKHYLFINIFVQIYGVLSLLNKQTNNFMFFNMSKKTFYLKSQSLENSKRNKAGGTIISNAIHSSFLLFNVIISQLIFAVLCNNFQIM